MIRPWMDAALECVARDIRRGVAWAVVPLALSSVVRLALEPAYASLRYVAWLVALGGWAAALVWLMRRLTVVRCRLALALNFAAIYLGYVMIGVALRAHEGWRADDLLFALDRLLFRGDPQRFLAPLQSPLATTVMLAGYVGFVGFVLFLFLSEAFVVTRATGRVQLGLMRLYGIGFSGYLLMPAAGPVFHHPRLLAPIVHSGFSRFLNPWVVVNCSHVDVFPSLHAAVCAFALVWTRHRHPAILPWLLAPAAALLLGTVYLQYHYCIDLPLGLALGAAAAWSVVEWPHRR